MAYFLDLSPYTYGNREPARADVVNVGWLSIKEPFPTGAVPAKAVAILAALVTAPVNRYRGFHCCEFCSSRASSNGEIRVVYKGRTYVAPQLIHHYVTAHDYRPPDVFIEALVAQEDSRLSDTQPTQAERDDVGEEINEIAQMIAGSVSVISMGRNATSMAAAVGMVAARCLAMGIAHGEFEEGLDAWWVIIRREALYEHAEWIAYCKEHGIPPEARQ